MKRIGLLSCLWIICLYTSCLKKAFDHPEDRSNYDPMIPVTHSIASLKALNGFYNYQTGGDTTLITEEVTIAGIVTVDDRSGNFYKQIVMEDSSAAIMVLIDANNLYNDYPVGRKIYIRCKGLYLGYDGGLPVLGWEPTPQLIPNAIPNDQVSAHIIKAYTGHSIEPAVVTLAQVKSAYESLYNRLIRITGSQFADTSASYSQPNGTTNRDLQDCFGNKMLLRTSNFAAFASFGLPKRNGTITGIYTVYISSVSANKTPQLLIRDTNDVSFQDPRCVTGVPPLIYTITIDSLRHLFTGAQSNLSNYKISGIVISDRSNKNIDSRNLVLQDGVSGIMVRFSAVHSFNLGDSLVLDISGAQLGEYNGLLEVGSLSGGNSFQTSKALSAGSDKMPAATVITIADLLAAPEKFESTLVRIVDATASGGLTYVTGTNGSKTLADISGSVTLYTLSGAVFANAGLPSTSMTWTGIFGQFGSTRQLSIRNLDDVQ